MTERNTRQKRAIQEVLAAAEAPMSVQDILQAAQAAVPTLSQATVYRVLRTLTDRGELATVQLPGEVPLYEMAGKSHHHFFRCRKCAHMYEIKGCTRALGHMVPADFELEHHEIFLFGLCPTCR